MSTDTAPGGATGESTGADVEPLPSPQLVLDAQMLRSWYIPADREAARALVPSSLQTLDNDQVFLNQYVVGTDEQTSGLGAYELTYAGLTVAGHDVGGLPAHWLCEFLNSNPQMRAYTVERGFPASEGRTHLVRDGDTVTATTEVEGTPVVKTVARVGERNDVMQGQIGYITDVGGSHILGRYPFVADVADPIEILSIDFLEPDHPIYALRPAQPLEINLALYAPRISFCYPGGEAAL